MTDQSIPQETPHQKASRELNKRYREQLYDAEISYRRQLDEARAGYDRQYRNIKDRFPNEAAGDG